MNSTICCLRLVSQKYQRLTKVLIIFRLANPFGQRPPGSPTTRKERVKDHFDLQAKAVKYEMAKEKTKKQRKAEEKARKKAEKDAKKQAKKEKKKGGGRRRASDAATPSDIPPDQVRGSAWDPFK